MNERIRAHDLWTQVCQEDMPELDETFMTMRRTRKFAELIVKECVQAIQNESMNSSDEFEHGLRFAEGAILDHFGVKE